MRAESPIPVIPWGDILIRADRRWIKIACKEMILLEGAKDYVKIYTTTSPTPYLVKGYLKQLEAQLPADYFCRVHRSYIIGIYHVRHICDDVVNLGAKDVPLTKSYAAGLYSRFIVLDVLKVNS